MDVLINVTPNQLDIQILVLNEACRKMATVHFVRTMFLLCVTYASDTNRNIKNPTGMMHHQLEDPVGFD